MVWRKYRPTYPALNLPGRRADLVGMEASAYALVHGIRRTRLTLAAWNQRPWPVLMGWLAGSLAAACTLLLAVWVIGAIAPASGPISLHRPPLATGGPN